MGHQAAQGSVIEKIARDAAESPLAGAAVSVGAAHDQIGAFLFGPSPSPAVTITAAPHPRAPAEAIISGTLAGGEAIIRRSTAGKFPMSFMAATPSIAA